MFIAEKGQGAYLNDKRLRVAARKEMRQALLATGIPFLGRRAMIAPSRKWRR